jgi:hypothetical protein
VNLRPLAAVAASLISLSALSGCVGTSDRWEDLSRPAEPTPTASAIPGDTDGDGKLSGWESEALAAAVVDATPLYYALPDGSSVLVDKDAPLPPAVVDAIAAFMAPASKYLMGSPRGYDNVRGDTEIGGEMLELAIDERDLLFVFETSSDRLDGGGTEYLWGSLANGGRGTGNLATDKASAIIQGQAWADTHKAELIVVD